MEIKFRVWDKHTKQMLTGFSLFGEVTLIGGIHAWQHECGNNKSSLEALNDLIIMQYTGVDDKNGKNIYDGDIVEEDEIIIKRVSVVEWCGHGFWIKDEHFGWEGEGLWDWGNLTVLGNIYENPELLNNNDIKI